MSSTWSSGIGKFPKKDPNHGKWWKWIKDNWNAFWKYSLIRNKRKK